jgi:hypothetical protein
MSGETEDHCPERWYSWGDSNHRPPDPQLEVGGKRCLPLPHLVGVKAPNFIAFLVDCRYRYLTGQNGPFLLPIVT